MSQSWGLKPKASNGPNASKVTIAQRALPGFKYEAVAVRIQTPTIWWRSLTNQPVYEYLPPFEAALTRRAVGDQTGSYVLPRVGRCVPLTLETAPDVRYIPGL